MRPWTSSHDGFQIEPGGRQMNEQRLQRRGRRGSILLIAAGMMFMLLAFVGLAFDVGYVQWSRRRAQTAADAAALAGAWAVQLNRSYVADGKTSSKVNGFEDGQNGVTVQINKPPLNEIGRASC